MCASLLMINIKHKKRKTLMGACSNRSAFTCIQIVLYSKHIIHQQPVWVCVCEIMLWLRCADPPFYMSKLPPFDSQLYESCLFFLDKFCSNGTCFCCMWSHLCKELWIIKPFIQDLYIMIASWLLHIKKISI